MSVCDFTYKHYEEILGLISHTDYKVTFFNEAYLNDKELILRHDIDVDLNNAHRMALIENKFRVRTTYFILIRSPFYNIFDRSNSDIIRDIIAMGHQIGLHFDETYYGLFDAEKVIKSVDSEVQILKDYFDTKILAVSFHRPSQIFLQSDIKLNNSLINTYNRSFTKEFMYISDSRRMWKEDCLCKFLEKKDNDCSRPDRIQALIHPIWWTDKSQSAQDAIEKFLIKKLSYLDCELMKNIQIYKGLL